MRGGRRSVSRGDRRGIWRDQRRAGSDYISKRTKAARQSPTKLWPTCRLVSSLEVGPGAIVGTLKQGYPYYNMKTLCRRGYLESRGEQHPTLPRGRFRGRHVSREDNTLQGINSGSGPPWESAGPLYIRTGPPGKVQDLHGYKPDPWDGSWTPLCGVRATHSRVLGF
jgi:hypothetical protein